MLINSTLRQFNRLMLPLSLMLAITACSDGAHQPAKMSAAVEVLKESPKGVGIRVAAGSAADAILPVAGSEELDKLEAKNRKFQADVDAVIQTGGELPPDKSVPVDP
jgi:hypothetical protein